MYKADAETQSCETRKLLPLLLSFLLLSLMYPVAYSQPHENCRLEPCLVVYENSNFSGRSISLPAGNYRLSDFNDIASSVKVPQGLGAIIYEHADEGGGYGISVDLLEDHNDLSRFDLNDKVSYISVFSTYRPGYFWARNSIQNRQFVSGHWEHSRVVNPINPVAVASPSLPPHTNTPAPAPAPFELVFNTEDDNWIALNPKWGWQVTHGAPPNPTQCTDGPFKPPCYNNAIDLDTADICGIAPAFGKGNNLYGVSGHANYLPATYVGKIIWDTHSNPCDTYSGLSSLSCDDDYNFSLYTPNDAGVTTTRDNLQCEFDSDETIDHFDTPWWNSFHDAVDQTFDLQVNERFFKENGDLGRYAIVTGLLGLEMVHGGSPELHPVWAMAIRVKDDDPADEVWAMFVRRWGNEGFCSASQHDLLRLPNDTFTFRLPWRPGASDVQLGAATTFKANYDFRGTVQAVSDQGVLVSFPAPSSDSDLIEGELHLRWPGGRGPAPIPAQVHGTALSCEQGCQGDCFEFRKGTVAYEKCMGNCKKGCTAGDRTEPERRFAAYLTTLTQPQRLEISMLNPPSPVSHYAKAGRMNILSRTQSFPIRGPQTVQSGSVPDIKKRARNQRLLQTLNKFRNLNISR
jgi:hypothetical protein